MRDWQQPICPPWVSTWTTFVENMPRKWKTTPAKPYTISYRSGLKQNVTLVASAAPTFIYQEHTLSNVIKMSWEIRSISSVRLSAISVLACLFYLFFCSLPVYLLLEFKNLELIIPKEVQFELLPLLFCEHYWIGSTKATHSNQF